MTTAMPTSLALTLISIIIALVSGVGGEGNLSCYQCTKTTPEPCPEETLLPCPSNKDRCVTHITKDPVNGYSIKRECGLGPCGFQDDMVNRGLGLDTCDTHKDDVFCVFCCKESGCNGSHLERLSSIVAALTACALILHFLKC